MEIGEAPIDNRMDFLSTSHADLRSSEKAANRLRKQKQKYYAYRGVHPSWVGQLYYTLTLVSEETVTDGKRNKQKKSHATAVVENEHEALLEKILSRQDFPTSMTLASSIHQAISETRASRSTATNSAHGHETLSPQHSPSATLEAPTSFTQLTQSWEHNAEPLSDLLAQIPNSRLKLKLKPWTKRDNFEQKEFFSSGPDRRHSKSRRIREWNSQHYDIRRLGRAARQQAAQRRDVEEEKEQAVHGVSIEQLLDGWGWNGDVFEYNPAIFTRTGPGPWITWVPGPDASDDVTADDDDDADADADADAQEGNEDTTEAVDERSEVLSMLESLLASSEIVIVARPRSDVHGDDDSSVGFDLDYDNMSDLADAVADIEWEILSDCGQGHDSAPVTGADDDVT